jgi:hypothetical protein
MKILLIPFIFISIFYAEDFKLRKYNNVKKFYQAIAKDVVYLSIQYKTPPATILAIAGLESGYGSGYVAQITGNILSLGAGKTEKKLPALNLPYCNNDKNKTALFDPKDQQDCKILVWEKRPKSLKKDYRPKTIAGTNNNLEFFKYSPKLYRQAQLNNIKDFLTKWINKDHKYQPFKQSRLWLDKKISQNGINTLFELETNLEFIRQIGGKQNSFNYRKSWLTKVEYILNNTGLVELCKDIYYHNKNFQKAWDKKI